MATCPSEDTVKVEDDGTESTYTPGQEDIICMYQYYNFGSAMEGLPTGGWDNLDLEDIHK